MTDDTHAILERFLTAADLPHERIDDARWVLQMRGERKLTIPVTITVRAERVTFESFFMRHPQENHDDFYAMLLRRNARASGIAFALDADGDVYLVGAHPRAAIDDAELDRIMGAILVEADGMFTPAIELGFASYLARDRAWRDEAARAADADA